MTPLGGFALKLVHVQQEGSHQHQEQGKGYDCDFILGLELILRQNQPFLSACPFPSNKHCNKYKYKNDDRF